MADAWQFWSSSAIAAATGSPEANIRAQWPALCDALHGRGIGDRPVQQAAIATTAVESGSFLPVAEAYWLAEPQRTEYLTKMYEGRSDLGNTQEGDGRRFKGRGFVQITGRSNYTTYGNILGVDLVGNPDLALRPDIAANVFAVYFTNHYIRWEPAPAPLMNCADLARVGEWRGVRVAVNGGENGLARFMDVVNELEAGGPPVPTVTYNSMEPAITQNDQWSCAPTSTRWSLYAVGRRPTEGWIESQMKSDGIVSEEQGLLDATGRALAGWITEQYQEFGYYANHEAAVSFNALAAEIGPYPMLIGGRSWGGPGLGHWSGLRAYDSARGVLLLANPAGNSGSFGGQEMTRAQFAARGPFSMVRVLHPDLLESEPQPIPPIPPVDTRLTRARAKMVEAIAILDEPAP
jgi:hypothetical protein